jgi:hypothetical protein
VSGGATPNTSNELSFNRLHSWRDNAYTVYEGSRSDVQIEGEDRSVLDLRYLARFPTNPSDDLLPWTPWRRFGPWKIAEAKLRKAG